MLSIYLLIELYSLFIVELIIYFYYMFYFE